MLMPLASQYCAAHCSQTANAFKPLLPTSLCHGSRDNELLVQACLGRGQFNGAREVVLLQASNSFFAYEPILKALQQMTVLPMAQYLVPALAPPGEPLRCNTL
jgi:hypothetical protein